MLIDLGFDIAIRVVQPTVLTTLLDIHGSRHHDVVDESGLATTTASPRDRWTDRFGNSVRRFDLVPGRFELSYRARVRDTGAPDLDFGHAGETPVSDLPRELLQYLAPSRYCDSDTLSSFAWNTFGRIAPGAARVKAIADFAHGHIRFDYNCASSTRSASQAIADRAGVCRDYAHLTIALCRAMNIPARYVNGYLGDIGVPACPLSMDFSAWCEVFIGNEWVTVDARHNVPRIGRVVIARGMDAADVAMLTTFGPHYLERFVVYTDELVGSQDKSVPIAA